MSFTEELEMIRTRAAVTESRARLDENTQQLISVAARAIAQLLQQQTLPPVSTMKPAEKANLQAVATWLQGLLKTPGGAY